MPGSRVRRRRRPRLPLGELLALQSLVCRAFGTRTVRAALQKLAEAADGDGSLSPERREEAITGLGGHALPEFPSWERNLRRHERRLRLTPEHGRGLKPHQYLALLFTEYYLDRYFTRPDELLAELDGLRASAFPSLPRYERSDLEMLAFQSATGSGKTLLMHVHIEQYRHYARRAGRRLNAVILLTPNERMSEQHLRELRTSRLPARLFTADAPRELVPRVEVFDLNKLAEKKGVRRIAVSEFGDDNLVLVDEGHLGASGKAWRKRRAELARGGFTLEYSATFDQIVGKELKTGPNETGLRDCYGKSLLFDYPYRDFHADGYGKDYSIVNLPGGAADQNSDIYLLGCLLTFYRQLRLFGKRRSEWRAFHLARPLLAFLGKTVLGKSRSKLAETTRSDVLLILDFVGRFLAERPRMEEMLEALLAGESGLLDESGGDWFAGRLGKPDAPSAPELYADICETVFHGQGSLHIEYLTAGGGELHLRVADRPVFGVVNVGDSAGLYQRLAALDHAHLRVERNLISAPLFAEVDRESSTVNIVVGARRFIAGWNSWRVSTMGLMHVGVGEGPEIVQMFGRGVRLKGWNLSLKRHSATEAASRGGEDLRELETLHIFGLRANYMETFRDLMRGEGLEFETATIRLPVTWNFGRVTDLKILRLAPGDPFERSAARPSPPDPESDDGRPVVRRSLYSTVEFETSGASSEEGERELRAGSLKDYAPLFDEARLHERVLARKEQAGWWNLSVDRETVRRLLRSDGWYELSVPVGPGDPRSVADLARLEELAAGMIAEYFERCWRNDRSRWEETRLRAVPLDESDDDDIRAHELTAAGAEAQLLRDLEGLGGIERRGKLEDLRLGELFTRAHACQPLLWSGVGPASEVRKVEVRPAPLNPAERRVVRRLKKLAEEKDPVLTGRDLFLIRNQSRGRGVSFFDDFAYYPDFIVWLRNDDSQHVLFLDPKGLGRYGRREREKVGLHRRIKDIEVTIRKSEPGLFLHAYVLSTTPAGEVDEGARSVADWKREGVYFLDQQGSVRDLIADALSGGAAGS